MSTLEAKMDMEMDMETVQDTGAVEIIDCGCASEGTHGVPNMIIFEAGAAPYNRLLF